MFWSPDGLENDLQPSPIPRAVISSVCRPSLGMIDPDVGALNQLSLKPIKFRLGRIPALESWHFVPTHRDSSPPKKMFS